MNLTVDIRAEEFLARLAGSQDRLQRDMVKVVTRLSIEVQGAVKDKLTGKVLHVRTGTLRRSINRKVDVTPSGAVATIGTNVKYAGVHEFGFNGEVTVKAHGRKMRAGVIAVRQHTRKMHMPERSYLRSTLKDFALRIRTEIKEAAVKAVIP